MKPTRWKLKIALVLVGVAAVIAARFLWPMASFWHTKRQLLQTLEQVTQGDRSALNCVLAAEIENVPPRDGNGQRITYRTGGYVFSLPAATYRRKDPNRPGVLESDRLSVHVLGVGPETPQLAANMAPREPEVVDYFRQTDPYQILVDAYTTTPADVKASATRPEFEKALHLIMLRSIVQPVGADKLWMRFIARGRKGFLAGDTTCQYVYTSIYLPEGKEFATVTLQPKQGTALDDIWACLGSLVIEVDPNVAASMPSPVR